MLNDYLKFFTYLVAFSLLFQFKSSSCLNIIALFAGEINVLDYFLPLNQCDEEPVMIGVVG